MVTQEELFNLCSIEQDFINELFDDFFGVRGIKVGDNINFDDDLYYSNCEVIKIEIKDGKTYEHFIDQALEKITEYYLNGDAVIRGKSKDFSIDFVLSQLNQYTPIQAISYSYIISQKSIKVDDETYMSGPDFIKHIEKLENHSERKKSCSALSFETIQADSLNLDEKYILKNGALKSSRQILGYLHGDIGEFILFLLVEGFIKSPLLFSKIRHCKSSPGDKVKGSDGIHIEVNEDGDYVYNFLESKINKDFSSSVKQVIESNEEFLDNLGEGDVNNEVTILFNNSNNINGKYDLLFDGDYNSTIVPYLNDTGAQESLPFNIISLIAYNCQEYVKVKSGQVSDKDYIDNKTINRIKILLKKYKVLESKLAGRNVKVFMLPLIDEVELIKIFLDKIKKEKNG